MIMITYSALGSSLFDPMDKDSTNLVNLKPSFGTRINDTAVNDHVLSTGCDKSNKTLIIPGGKFNGPSIKYILQDKVLNDLESKLPTYSIAQNFTNYFRCIRDLLKTCTAKILDTTETQRVIDSFTNQFYHLFMEYNLSMTLKVHIIIHHYQYYQKW